ncbi:MAG: murein biosynthesis integral membrane protein MurJ, partial [Bacillota bacterium]|nr:murein biosynthesis integral membrane protein MurJ [Bacillota bacterium]
AIDPVSQDKNIRPAHIKPVKEKGPSKRTLNRSTATVLMMVGLLLSKITGQLREILIVPIFGGIGIETDAFVIGFQVPDLFYQLLVGGAIQAAITPTLAAALACKQEKKGWHSISIFINLAAVTMLLAVLIGELSAPLLITLYNQGKDPAIIDLAIKVTRALFPQVFFMMLAALCIGILNAYKKFASTSFGPSVYNICVILAMVFLGQASPRGAIRVASGVMLAACIYFLMQFYLARREFSNYVFSFNYRDKGFRRLLFLAIPTLISGSIVQVNTIILTAFANQFVGAATSLRQASTTWQLPYGVFVVAIGNVMLPSLAGTHAAGDLAGGRQLFTRSLRTALFLVFPSAALFLAMQQDTIRAIFQWSSHYPDSAVNVTASILRWYCIAMVAQTFIFIVNQSFYARRVTRIALYNGIMTVVLNTLLCLALTRWTQLGVSSLSLAYMLTSIISALVLYQLYSKGFKGAAPRRLWPFLIRCSLCTSALLLTVLILNRLPISPDGKIWQLIWYGLRAAIGFLTYLGLAMILRMPESRQVTDRIGRLAAHLRQ